MLTITRYSLVASGSAGMEFRIADNFTAALTNLTHDEQKAVKTSVFDLQTNPEHPGLKWHRIGDSKDPNFWSCRVSRDIRTSSRSLPMTLTARRTPWLRSSARH